MVNKVYKVSKERVEFLRKIAKLAGRKRILKDKICPACGEIFRPKGSITKHCSWECNKKDRPHKGILKKCEICKKEFYVSQCFKKAKFCSNKCRHIGLRIPESKVELVCKICNKKYITGRSHIKHRGSSFCSMDCFKKWRKKVKKSKKPTNYKKRLWLIFSQYIRQRDEGVCISCGKRMEWKNMDAGHYIPKTAGLALYFDERNVNCQCTYCNRFMHGNLAKYALALRKKYGGGILEKLDKERRQIRKISEDEYVNLIELYKKKMENLDFKLNGRF